MTLRQSPQHPSCPPYQPHQGKRSCRPGAAPRDRGEGGLVVPIFLWMTPKRKNMHLLHHLLPPDL